MVSNNSSQPVTPRNGAVNGNGASQPMQQIVIAKPISAPQQSQDGKAPDPSAILHALRRRWAWALPIGLVLAGLGGFAGWQLIQPKYTASAFLRINADNERLLFETADGVNSNFKTYKNTQKQLMLTPFVLVPALRDESVSGAQTLVDQDPLDWFRENLQVTFPGDGEVMQVTTETESDKDCVNFVNAVVKAYMEEVVVNERNARIDRKETLEKARLEAESKVRAKRAALKETADTLGTSDAESLTLAEQNTVNQFGRMQEQLGSVQFDLMQAEGDLVLAQQQLERYVKTAEALKNAPEGEGEEPLVDMAAPPRPADIIRLEDEINVFEAKLGAMRESAGSNHPTVRRFEMELEGKREQLARHEAEFQKTLDAKARSSRGSKELLGLSPEFIDDFQEAEIAVASRSKRVEILKNQESILKTKVDELYAEIRKLNKSSFDLDLMSSELEYLEGVLSRLGEEIERTNIELRTASRVSLISEAASATPPSPKKRLAAVGALGAFGLFLPFVAFIAFDLRRKTVNNVETTAESLQLETLGTLPIVSRDPFMKGSSSRGRHARQTLELMESVDSAAAMLLHRGKLENRSIFMVSSAVANEGKSTVSCLLAESLSKCGKKVAIVDFDLRRPSVARYMDLPGSPGVAEVLSGESSFSEALHETAIPNLFVLPAGNSHHIAFQEYASNGAFDRLFDNLRLTFDLVIVDSSPVLPIVDSRVVGRFTDGVILTLIRDSSRIPATAQACAVLKSHGVEVLGTIMIGARSSQYSGYYYYQQEMPKLTKRPAK